MEASRKAGSNARASASERRVLWMIRQVRRLGPLPLAELRRQYGARNVTGMIQHNELRAVNTDAGVLYAVGPKGYEAIDMGRWNQPEPNALVNAFARRVGFEWWREQGYEEWWPEVRATGRDPRGSLNEDLQRLPLKRFAIRRDPDGSVHHSVCYVAAFPWPSSPTVRRVFQATRRADEVVVFTTRPDKVLTMKHVPHFVKAVDWFDVAEAARPAMGEAIRRALAAKGEAERRTSRPRRSSARTVPAKTREGHPAPTPKPRPPKRAPREVVSSLVQVSDAARRLLGDLEVDRVTTLGFVERQYGVTRAEVDALGMLVRPARVVPSTSGQAPMEVVFVYRASEPSLARMDVARLRHLAGVTALRHELGAPTDEWVSAAEAVDASLVPDALWRERRAVGVFRAIEFDAGSYDRSQVAEKVAFFDKEYGMQFWGVASDQRVDFVKGVMREQTAAATVKFVQWW